MSEVNKIVTIEQLKKAIQDYHGYITEGKILTDEDLEELYGEYLTGSSIESLEETLNELNNKGWLDDRLGIVQEEEPEPDGSDDAETEEPDGSEKSEQEQ